MGRMARARMKRHERLRPESALDAGEDRRQGLGTVDHREPAAGVRSARPARIQATSGASPALASNTRARAVAASAGRRTAPASKKGGLVTTCIGAFGREPRRGERRAVEHVGRDDPRPRAKSVARRVALGERRGRGIDLDQIAGRALAPAEDCKADRADASAEIDDAALGEVERGGKESRVRSGAVAAPRLGEDQPAAEPGVAGDIQRPVVGRVIHRAIRLEPRLRQEPPRAPLFLPLDQDAARQEAERPLDGGHVLIGDEEADARRAQERLRPR